MHANGSCIYKCSSRTNYIGMQRQLEKLLINNPKLHTCLAFCVMKYVEFVLLLVLACQPTAAVAVATLFCTFCCTAARTSSVLLSILFSVLQCLPICFYCLLPLQLINIACPHSPTHTHRHSCKIPMHDGILVY